MSRQSCLLAPGEAKARTPDENWRDWLGVVTVGCWPGGLLQASLVWANRFINPSIERDVRGLVGCGSHDKIGGHCRPEEQQWGAAHANGTLDSHRRNLRAPLVVLD